MATPFLDLLILQLRRHPEVQDLYDPATGTEITTASQDGVYSVDEMVAAIVRGTNAFLTAAYEQALSMSSGDIVAAGERMCDVMPELMGTKDLANGTGSSGQKYEVHADLPNDYMAPLSLRLDMKPMGVQSATVRSRVRFTTARHADAILYDVVGEELGPVAHVVGNRVRIVTRDTDIYNEFPVNNLTQCPTMTLRYVRYQKSITQGGNEDLLLGTRFDAKVVPAAAQLIKVGQ